MNESATMLTGPLGSTIHVLRADAGTIAELAAVDWSRHFRRVCLDPVRGVITLMAPSHPHEESDLDLRRHRGRRGVHPRRRDEEAPQSPAGRTGRAARHGDGAGLHVLRRRARQRLFRGPRRGRRRRSTPTSSVSRRTWWWRSRSRTPMRARPSATGRWGCGSCGGCTGARGTRELRAEFLALGPAGSAPRKLDASEVLEGLTPGDVCEAVDGVRFGLTLAERMEAVARIVRRRQQASVRVREEEAAYSPG